MCSKQEIEKTVD